MPMHASYARFDNTYLYFLRTALRTNSTRAVTSPTKTSRPMMISPSSGTKDTRKKLLLGGSLEPKYIIIERDNIIVRMIK